MCVLLIGLEGAVAYYIFKTGPTGRDEAWAWQRLAALRAVALAGDPCPLPTRVARRTAGQARSAPSMQMSSVLSSLSWSSTAWITRPIPSRPQLATPIRAPRGCDCE